MADLLYALSNGSPSGYVAVYNNLQTWWDTEVKDYDFVTNGNRKILEGFDDWTTDYYEIGSPQLLAGTMVTNADNYALIRSAPGHRHNGTTGSGFGIKCTNWAENWLQEGNHTHLEDFEVVGGSSFNGLEITNATNARLKGLLFSGSCQHGISGLLNGHFVESCIVISSSAGSRGIANRWGQSGGVANNCVTVGFNNGYYVDSGGLTCYNCAALGINANSDFQGAITGDYNAASDGTAPGANSIQDLTGSDFVDSANDDYHITQESRLATAGTNLYDGSGEQTDIDGEAWPAVGAWSIGADYPGGEPPVTSKQNAIFHGINM